MRTEKPLLLSCVKLLSKSRHARFSKQLELTPSLFAEMLVHSGCLDIANVQYTSKLMQKARALLWALHHQRPDCSEDVTKMMRSLLDILDDKRYQRLLAGLALVVNYVLLSSTCNDSAAN
jgi:hypothetical protein